MVLLFMDSIEYLSHDANYFILQGICNVPLSLFCHAYMYMFDLYYFQRQHIIHNIETTFQII
jgi:hypothetical protein